MEKKKSEFEFKPRLVSSSSANNLSTVFKRMEDDIQHRHQQKPVDMLPFQFKPQLVAQGRSSSRTDAIKANHGSIFQYLYAQHRKKKIKDEFQKQNNSIQQNIENNFRVTNKSTFELAHTRFSKQFSVLFKQLLVEGHQHISKDLINLTVIEPCALQVLIPLLEEMEQLETTLDEDEFVESCHCLLRTLTLPERD